ncbi:MAG: alanyl-tRNA synthetase, partial [Candidatus Woesebacteria bacterium GW2011_GWD2_40_19]
MGTDEIREKYLDFFKKKGHIEITPSPLVIDSDPTTLFTSSGMQQLAPYLKGEKHSKGKKLVDIQPSIRMQDLDEVADNRHFSFFEMLGNWSLG